MALFLAIAVISAIALIWMGLRLLEQDRALESQQLEERQKTVADRVVGILEQVLFLEERKLTETTSLPVGEDAVIVIATRDELHVQPEGSVLYYPKILTSPEIPPKIFADAERYEFIDHNYNRAISALQALSKSKDPAIRAGAQLRLARNLRKAGRSDAALDIYGGLSKTDIALLGTPVGLLAQGARCAMLRDLGRTDSLKKEAQQLYELLSNAHWPLDRDTYLYYAGQLAQWIEPTYAEFDGRRTLTEAVFWLWENLVSNGNLKEDTKGRRALLFYGTPVTVLWQVTSGRMTAMVAGPGYQRLRWLDPSLGDPGFRDVRISIRDPSGFNIIGAADATGVPETLRLAASTTLPWDIAVATADAKGAIGSFAQRRRLMMTGLAAVALLLIAASYLIARAVSRELAAARLQSDFVSAVSHEFRTPLTSMRQFTEMLVEDDNLTPEKRRSFYKAQDRATRRLTRLVESLLDFGRMEAGARPYRLEPLDAGQLVKAVVEEFGQEHTSNDFSIDCNLPSDSATVNADQDALTQALWNILDNAVKYSGENKRVCVEVEGGSSVVIRVHDEGYGIAPSEQRQILRKFVRGSAAKAHGVKGTGIGLAMVRHIVDAHGGKLLIESKPGRGSTFTIQLPAGG
jgi:signal transduction histidine kinase